MQQVGKSESVDDFVKAVYMLQQEHERASTNALKDALDISAPSVTDMAKRLVEIGLVDYVKYQGVKLTEKGEAMALNLVRRHRLIELYLVRELGYALHEVHEEADNLEHAVSDRFILAIDAKLGHPKFDPHGDPIPHSDGTITRRNLRPLSQLPLATLARVSRLISTDTQMLQHTIDRGFALNTEVEVTARDPFEGPLTITVGSQQTVIGFNVAESILVEVMS
ncbi:MAG: metal-dependent transcriptional regulator [Anaerolineae bacterium]|nr:metal-dependent transcriptional regulator [Anaerolineae bacterium]MDQ7037563.1 metal-dependent transcriptional regulator [Anaerolineae bacterium]